MAGKKIYTVIALLLLMILYLMIFYFSSEDADRSSDITTRVTKALLQFYYKIKGGSGNQQIAGYTVSSAEGFIRKLAHFTEYACVGFLSYSIVVVWFGTIWKGRFWVIVQLLLSAAADELHQYFVPGRNAAVKDVLIDTAGGIAGMLVILAGALLWRLFVRGLRAKKNNT